MGFELALFASSRSSPGLRAIYLFRATRAPSRLHILFSLVWRSSGGLFRAPCQGREAASASSPLSTERSVSRDAGGVCFSIRTSPDKTSALASLSGNPPSSARILAGSAGVFVTASRACEQRSGSYTVSSNTISTCVARDRTPRTLRRRSQAMCSSRYSSTMRRIRSDRVMSNLSARSRRYANCGRVNVMDCRNEFCRSMAWGSGSDGVLIRRTMTYQSGACKVHF